jgi:hypothetical protein
VVTGAGGPLYQGGLHQTAKHKHTLSGHEHFSQECKKEGKYRNRAWWWVPVFPAAEEPEVGRPHKSRSSRPSWATQWDPFMHTKTKIQRLINTSVLTINFPVALFAHHYFFFFLVALGFELRASHLLGRCCTAWDTPPVHFALVILEMVVSQIIHPKWLRTLILDPWSSQFQLPKQLGLQVWAPAPNLFIVFSHWLLLTVVQ